MANSVFLNYGTSYFDLLSQRIDDNEAEITDVVFQKLNKPDPIVANTLLYVKDVDGNTASSTILCQSNNALQSIGCLQLPGTSVNPATIIPELSGKSATTVWLNSTDGHLYRGSVDLETSGGGGDVVGSASSTDNSLVRFDGSTGKIIQPSIVSITDNGGVLGSKFIQITSSPTNPGGLDTIWRRSPDNVLLFGTTNLMDTGGDVFSSTNFTTDNRIPRFDGTTGKLIKDSSIIITDNSVIGGVVGQNFITSAVNPFDLKTLWMNQSNALFFGSIPLTDYITTPAVVVDNFVPRWDGTGGRNIQSSPISISDGGAITIDNASVKGYLNIQGNPAQYLDLTNDIVAVGRSIGSVTSNSVLVGTSTPNFASNNSIVVGNKSCQVQQPSVLDLIVVGNNCGSAGSGTIAVGHRISVASATSSLGLNNLLMGNDMDVRNSTSECVALSSNSKIQGLRSVVVGRNNKVSGNDNVVVGVGTLAAITSNVSNNNVLLGSGILPLVSGVSGSVIIGTNSGSTLTTSLSNCLWIDADGVDGETNTTRIGKAGKTSCYMYGIYAQSAPSLTQKNVKINSDGRLVGTFETRPYGCHTASISTLTNGLTPLYSIAYTTPSNFKIVMGVSPTSYFSSDGLFVVGATVGSIRYVGTAPVLVKYTWGVALTATGGVATFYLLKNNVFVPNTVCTSNYMLNGNSAPSFITTLITNDVLEIGASTITTAGIGNINVFTENRFVEIIG